MAEKATEQKTRGMGIRLEHHRADRGRSLPRSDGGRWNRTGPQQRLRCGGRHAISATPLLQPRPCRALRPGKDAAPPPAHIPSADRVVRETTRVVPETGCLNRRWCTAPLGLASLAVGRADRCGALPRLGRSTVGCSVGRRLDPGGGLRRPGG